MYPIMFLLPAIMGIINLIVVLTVGKNCTRKTLLNCTLIIKYGLMPFYLIAGFFITTVLLSGILPIPFLVIFGMATVLFLLMCYVFLLGTVPFAMAYIIKARKEGVLSTPGAVISGICQFLFLVDLVSMIVLTIKERHLVKTTIVMICLLLLIICALAAAF